MKLTFFGAAKAVTGSCHCVEVGGRKVLIDCGLQQGRDEVDNTQLDFAAGYIDAVVVTHAHIDHSGRIPLLVKQGFHGPIYCTRLTGQLLSIMLRDSAHIQEMDAQWKNQKGQRSGAQPVEPLYTVAEVETALELLETCEYGQELDILPGVRLRFTDAGHLLGSACAELWLSENGVEKKIVFSGDLGNVNQPIIRDPQPMDPQADYVVTESTYGDRNHEPPESYTQALAQIIDETFDRGGNVIIPAFAVGRTQELLYFMREMKEQNLVHRHPGFQVVVDSPLATEATRIFSGDLRGYLDEAAIQAIKGGALFTFPGLTLTESSEESKALNLDRTPKVILSASGMCDAGRIRHHLKHNLWRPECTIVFVGYQAPGSLGRALLEGIRSVKLFGEEIAVHAKIVNFKGLSSHADREHLLAWADQFRDPRPAQYFVVHGEAEVAEGYAQSLRDRGLAAHAPDYEEVYDLASNTLLAAGVPRAVKEKAMPKRAVSPAYRRLEDTVEQLVALVERSKGAPNKDLARLADQLRSLMDKFER
jgi:metallo-beta-lactamase family protein